MNVAKSRWLLGATLLGLQLAACHGAGGGGGGGVGSGGSGAPPPPQAVPIRRLTNLEYAASTADLFPGFTLPAPTFIADGKIFGFVNISSSQTGSRVRMEQYEAAAQTIAAGDNQTPQVWKGVTADPKILTGCDVAAMSETACAQPYLYDLAKRAYRRPLTGDEKTALWALFQSPAGGGDYKTRLALAIEGILISPNFLFRPEIGDPQQVVTAGILRLTPWEIATRLSYLINGSIPDPQLTAAADGNQLASRDQIAAHATRLLALGDSQFNVARMHEEWLGIDTVSALTKDPVAFPTFTPLLAVEMARETRAFITNVMFQQNGTFNDLLLSTYTFGNADIAAFYGVPAPATDWGRIDLPPTQRIGLLTQPSLMATLAKDGTGGAPQDLGTTIRRGKFVLQQLLCRTVTPPSPEILAMFPGPLHTELTARDQAKQHEAVAVCASCHSAIDPLGLPFEHFDMIGRWRDTDRGMPIDQSGVLSDADGSNQVKFDGVPGLAQLITQRAETRACYVQQWFQFATGKLKTPDDTAYIDWLTGRLAPDKKLVDFVVDMVTSDSFGQLKVDPTAGSGT